MGIVGIAIRYAKNINKSMVFKGNYIKNPSSYFNNMVEKPFTDILQKDFFNLLQLFSLSKIYSAFYGFYKFNYRNN